MWVALVSDNLGVFHNYNLSPKFNSIYSCQEYINEHLQELEEYLTKAFKIILKQDADINKNYRICTGGSFIRCYNLSQHRFCTGFDF